MKTVGQQFLDHCRILLVSTVTILSGGCDESLPPRQEPKYVLQHTFSPLEGTVLYLPFDTVSLGFPGDFLIAVKNLHDEVLQSDEDIHVDVYLRLVNGPSKSRHVLGDRNNVLNYEVLEGNQLTIEPDSSLRILVGWDQRSSEGKFFWEYSTLNTGGDASGPFFKSDPLLFEAVARIRSFKILPTYTSDPVRFSLTYMMRVEFPDPPWQVLAFTGSASLQGMVKLTWETIRDDECYGFYVERKEAGGVYETLPNGFVPRGGFGGHELYKYIDRTATTGSWVYRLNIMLDLGILKFSYGYSDTVQVDVP